MLDTFWREAQTSLIMNSQNRGSNLSKGKIAFVVGVAVVIGLVAGGIAGYLRHKTSPLLVEDHPVTYIVQFRRASLTKPEDRSKFVEALNETKLEFRRGMGIKIGNNCDPEELKDYNCPDCPAENCKQSDMGQQVTQRVGFNNLDNLKEALKYVQ